MLSGRVLGVTPYSTTGGLRPVYACIMAIFLNRFCCRKVIHIKYLRIFTRLGIMRFMHQRFPSGRMRMHEHCAHMYSILGSSRGVGKCSRGEFCSGGEARLAAIYNSPMPAPSLDAAARLRDNLVRVREQIATAAVRSGRRAEEVTLVGVTKYVDAAIARKLVEAGLNDLGESRPQALWEKAESLAGLPIRWHLIGHLQRNKVKRTLPLAACIHSADSLRLLEEISREAVALGRTTDVLLEVNISGEAAKHGFEPGQIEPLLPAIARLPHVAVRGLMAMAALEGGPNRARREFAALRELRDRLRTSCPGEISLGELSMGMSGDFEIAIEEGATMVRVGSALFEGIE